MKIGIDASNIRAGGGLTHLVELINAAEPDSHGFDEVVLWGGVNTLRRIKSQTWLHKAHEPFLDYSLPYRLYWQRYHLERLAYMEKCDLLFSPGGTYSGKFRPFVTMSQNMLPFEWVETRRFGYSLQTARYLLLRMTQLANFRKASGIIFLSKHAKKIVSEQLRKPLAVSALIPHGVDEKFRRKPRQQQSLEFYSKDAPFRLLYVSIINLYKHQWHVAEAVARLRNEQIPLAIDFVGPAFDPALHLLRQKQNQWDPKGEFIRYLGAIPYTELPRVYHQADAFVFASSCENMPNILLEAMASGLPIACSNRGPMPETLGETGVYFDPEQPSEIANSLRALLLKPHLREKLAEAAYSRSQEYSWARCAEDTFAFLAEIVHTN